MLNQTRGTIQHHLASYHIQIIIGKDRDPLTRDPLLLSLLSLTKAILSLIDSYVSLLSLIKAIFQRASKWGFLSFPMSCVIFNTYQAASNAEEVHASQIIQLIQRIVYSI